MINIPSLTKIKLSKSKTVSAQAEDFRQAQTEAVQTSGPNNSWPWERFSKWTVYALVFLIPLFFISGPQNYLDFPKQILLLSLVFLGIAFWLLGIISKGEAYLAPNFLHALTAIFFVSWSAAAFFSYSRYGSLWGWPLVAAEGVFSLLGFALLFFLISNLFRKKEEIIFLLLLFSGSGLAVSLFALLQIWGVFALPFNLTKAVSFNTVGSPTALVVFAATILSLISGLILNFKSYIKAFLSVCALASLILLLLVNSWPAWTVLFSGSAVFSLIVLLALKIQKPVFVVVPVLLVILSLVFIFVRQPLIRFSSLPAEIYPSYQATLKIDLKALKERPLTGTGPGTFIFNYAKFKDPALNETPFWGLRFRSGSSRVADAFGTAGVLGGGALILLLASALYFAWRQFKTLSEDSASRFLMTALMAGLVGSVAAFALSWNTTALSLVFWVLLGSISSLSTKQWKRFSLSENLSTVLSFVVVLVAVSGLVAAYLNWTHLSSEISYLKGIQEFNRGNSQAALEYFSKAIQRNPKHDSYYRDLAQIHLARIRQEVQRTDLSQDQIREVITPLIGYAVNSAKMATDLGPKNISNWLVRGFVFQSLIGLVGGADEAALNLGYQPALQLEPNSPYIVSSIGRVYIQRASMKQRQGDRSGALEDLKLAEEHLTKAIAMKSDFAPAHFNLAILSQLLGNTSQAIVKLEEAKNYAPGDVGLAFQLGVIYYQSQQFGKARAEFERAVSYFPNYSNARYFLGLLYDREGKFQEAVDQFLKIEELNPDNREVKRILANLRSARPALEGIAQSEPPSLPIEEKRPEEIK